MFKHIRLLLGISIFWLALSILTDGINTLVLPLQISRLAEENIRATLLGLLTFIGLFMGAVIQPVAGALSDRWKPIMGRKGFISIGLLFTLLSILLFAIFNSLAGMLIGYLLIQISASIAQAGQQGLMPDLVNKNLRGMASGVKGFMDISGAMLGFLLLGQLLGKDKAGTALGIMATVLIGVYLLAVLLTPEDRPRKVIDGSTASISLRRLFRLSSIQQSAFKHLLIARFLFLFGVYAIGRFLLFFVSRRLGLAPNEAAEQAGMLLGGLAFITILASPVTGWLADRFGRIPMMIAGAILSTVSVVLLIPADSAAQILLFGGLMSVGSAAFGSGSWALIADLVPQDESARYFGLANFSTAGPTAVAGLMGPVIDWTERISPGNGFTLLFIVAAIAFAASILPLLLSMKNESIRHGNKTKEDNPNDPGLAVLHLPADPASIKENHQNPPRGSSQL